MTQIEEIRRGVDSLGNPPKQGKKKMKTKTMKIGIIAMLILIAIGLATATLLTDSGGVDVNADINEAVTFDGQDDNTPIVHNIQAPGGSTRTFKTGIGSIAEEDNATLDLQTTYTPDGIGITTTIYSVPDITTLALNNKDSSWIEIDADGIEGVLVFETMSQEFVYELDVMGLIPDTDYSLIYYADPWSGNNPGLLIDAFTSDGTGVISVAGDVDLGMNLPQEADDNYLLGAKLWLVLSDDYDEVTCSMIAWNPDDYLFEHELIAYTDCDLTVEWWLAPLLGEPITGNLVLLPGEHVGLIFSYHFAINIDGSVPYTMSTRALFVV